MRFHHMLLFMADRDPSWRIMANSCVAGFLNDAEKRTKDYTPDLGRWVLLIQRI
jgi:hypothetical protein